MLGLRRGEEDAEEAPSRAALRGRRPCGRGAHGQDHQSAGECAPAARVRRSVTQPSAAAAAGARRGGAAPRPQGRAVPHLLPGGRARDRGLGEGASRPRRGARAPGGGRLPGGGADRRAEGGGGRGGVTGLSRWKCSESLFSARRGLELRASGVTFLSVCGGTALGFHLERGPSASAAEKREGRVLA